MSATTTAFATLHNGTVRVCPTCGEHSDTEFWKDRCDRDWRAKYDPSFLQGEPITRNGMTTTHVVAHNIGDGVFQTACGVVISSKAQFTSTKTACRACAKVRVTA